MGWGGSTSRPRAVLADFQDRLAQLPMDEALLAGAAEILALEHDSGRRDYGGTGH